MRRIIFIFAIIAGSAVLNCGSDATVASHNLRRAAEQFELNRRIIFLNGITDTYLLLIEGRCSLEHVGYKQQTKRLEVTCKLGENQYKKHHLGLSDNVTYFSEQLDPSAVNVYHYRVIFKPSVVIPDIDIR